MFMMSVRNAMKIRLAFVVALSLLTAYSFAANGTMKGEGTIESPFLVDDYEDLKMIGKGAYLYSSAYMLTADIDASASYGEWCSEGVCNGFIPLGLEKDAADASVFTGYFWGHGFTIRNMRIWTPCAHNVGFFANLGGLVSNLYFDSLVVWGGLDDIYAPHSKYVGAVAGTATGYILDVHVTKGEVQGREYVGGIVGDMEKTTANLDNVSYEGVVRGGSSVGGLAGRSRGRITDSNADVEIYAKGSDIGGLVGENEGDIEKSEAAGLILPIAGSSITEVGGLVGYNISGSHIFASRASVDILPLNTGIPGSDLGGLVGDNYGTIEQSYATGNVIGKNGVGGLVGSSHDGTIRNCFATGAVKGNRSVGGLVGNNSDLVRTSYSVGPVEILDTTEVVDVGGLVGWGEADSSYWNVEFSGLDTSSGGTGLSDAAMKKFESFFGWDTEIWTIDEGESYPYLAVFGKKPDAVVYAIPTAASKWQENPVVAANVDTGRELFGKWTGANYLNAARDSIYYGYKIGYVKESDTVWSTSSYMAVPNRIEIATLEDLQKIGRHVGFPLFANYELTADIDASGVDFYLSVTSVSCLRVASTARTIPLVDSGLMAARRIIPDFSGRRKRLSSGT